MEDHERCTAKAKSTGERCKNKAIAGGVCRLHGGLSPKGTAHWNFRHGGYSNYMPSDLGQRADAAYHDPDLKNLSKDIAAFTARLMGLYGQLSDGGGAAIWRELSRTHAAFIAASNQLQNAEGTARAALQLEISVLLNRIGELIEAGNGEVHVWDDIYDVTERVRRLTDTQMKIEHRDEYHITSEKYRLAMHYIVTAINNNVPDSPTRTLIFNDIRTFLSTA